jgi:hypothetical protein
MAIFFIFFIVLCVFRISNSEFNWNLTLLEGFPRVPENASIKYLVEKSVLEDLHWGWLFNTYSTNFHINKWHAIETTQEEASNDPSFLNGTTFWVNEHMAVGHAMYDIALIQVMQSAHIDRIVLQRAPCCVPGLCGGIGTFDGFYKGLYTAMMDAFQPGIPLYVRWARESTMKPLYLSGSIPLDYVDVPVAQRAKDIKLHERMVLERLIRKNIFCNPCFYPGISTPAIVKFKIAAYNLVEKIGLVKTLPHHFVVDQPTVILFAHRGLTASRHIKNTDFAINIFRNNFTSPKFEFRFVDTTNNTRTYGEQMLMVAQAQVVITEHGAFQSHLMYMRNGSLLIDLRGVYGHGEFKNFENLARMFGVFVQPVYTSNLESHRHIEFNITEDEVKLAISIAHEYINAAPFLFNLKK